MPTPAYGLKHWWRREGRLGESLKDFARRFYGQYTTSGKWMQHKGMQPPPPRHRRYDAAGEEVA
jgi:hypothetical protein